MSITKTKKVKSKAKKGGGRKGSALADSSEDGYLSVVAGLQAVGGSGVTTAVKETKFDAGGAVTATPAHSAAAPMLVLESGADHDDSDSITANTDAAFVALELGCLVERNTYSIRHSCPA